MPTTVHHKPIKYGVPQKKDGNMEPPSVPVDQHGSFHLSFDNRLWLFGRKWEPSGDVKATVIILHGTVDHSGVYNELALHLASKGIAVFASDMRGWGLSDGEPLFFHDLDTFVADVKADYDRIHSQPRYTSVKSRYILGKSLGGLIAAHTVARSFHSPVSHDC
jgi:alpha-beta hydrolase superfamily lysophospholipase